MMMDGWMDGWMDGVLPADLTLPYANESTHMSFCLSYCKHNLWTLIGKNGSKMEAEMPL